MHYPNGTKVSKMKDVCYGNRGMTLENDLNETNKYYLINDIAIVHKKPTPVSFQNIDYSNKHDVVIKEARFVTSSTTDYNGIYKGKYIDFEAKETKSNTSFPISNIHTHQLNHLFSIIKHGGIAFIIVRFINLNETYYLGAQELKDFLSNNDRKSIPYSYFCKYGHLIVDKYNPRVDYISIIDMLLTKEVL